MELDNPVVMSDTYGRGEYGYTGRELVDSLKTPADSRGLALHMESTQTPFVYPAKGVAQLYIGYGRFTWFLKSDHDGISPFGAWVREGETPLESLRRQAAVELPDLVIPAIKGEVIGHGHNTLYRYTIQLPKLPTPAPGWEFVKADSTYKYAPHISDYYFVTASIDFNVLIFQDCESYNEDGDNELDFAAYRKGYEPDENNQMLLERVKMPRFSESFTTAHGIDSDDYIAFKGRRFKGAARNDCFNYALECLSGSKTLFKAQEMTAYSAFSRNEYHVDTLQFGKVVSAPYSYSDNSARLMAAVSNESLKGLMKDKPMYDFLAYALDYGGGPHGINLTGSVLQVVPTLPKIKFSDEVKVTKPPACNYHAMYVCSHNLGLGYLTVIEANVAQRNLVRPGITLFGDGSIGTTHFGLAEAVHKDYSVRLTYEKHSYATEPKIVRVTK